MRMAVLSLLGAPLLSRVSMYGPSAVFVPSLYGLHRGPGQVGFFQVSCLFMQTGCAAIAARERMLRMVDIVRIYRIIRWLDSTGK